MEHIISKMNLSEHCPGCGALLPEEALETICGNCGLTTGAIEDLLYGRNRQSTSTNQGEESPISLKAFDHNP